MDRQIRLLGVAMLGLFALLVAQVNYIQVFAADRLANNPANQRLIIQEYRVDRGEILARDRKTVLAKSVPSGGTLRFLRRYPQGSLYAGVTGFYSLVFGRSELEQSYNDFLAARAPELLPENLADEILGRPKRGATVVTTIDPVLQEVAAEALAGRPGGVAAIDPRTGEVLALVSVPSFDPNPLSSHDPRGIRRTWNLLNRDPDKPMVSRANDELFPPGSTFKIVTAAAALENGMTPDTTFPNPPALDLPQTTHDLENFGRSHCLGGASQITLAQALLISCNVTFAQIGLQLGAEALVEQARAFGFGEDIPFDIPLQEGRFPDADAFADRLPAVAFSAIGQQDVGANPLQMALVAGAIANGGFMMKPQLVLEVRDPQGRVIRSIQPEVLRRPVSPETALALSLMMEGVVEAGTGTAAQIPGVRVAGKTGTAENPTGDPHAWFVAFAPAEEPAIAVAVVVLNGGDLGSEATGGQVAAPIARAVIEAALGR